MTLTEKDLKRFSLILLLGALLVLVFLIVKPLILTVIGGLILAYILFPVYKRVLRYVKSKNLAAALVSAILILLILVPIWFMVPLLLRQVFELFKFTQNLDIGVLVGKLLPATSDQLVGQISVATSGAISKLTSTILNSLVEFLINFPVIALHIFLAAFVFFFALRDEQKLGEFVSGLSPLSKPQEKILIKQFEDITQTVVYGMIVLGFLQGALAGLGLLLFNVPNALILTVIAVVLGILPIIGPGLVYVPVAIYLLIYSEPSLAIGYLIYNIVIVSGVDSVIKSYWLAKKTSLSQVLAFIGMIGGVFIFGVLGLIIGPLLLAYLITFLKAYKEKTLSSFFSP